ILIVFVVTVAMILFSSFTSWLSLFVTSAEGSLWFAFIGITAIVYGWKKKADLKNASTWLMLFGVIVTGFFAYITYQYLFLPYYGLNWTSPSLTLWLSLALVLGI